MSPLFDQSLLPRPLCRFVIVADTHYMLDPGDRPLEFESRRHQSARADAALKQIAALKPDFIVHLGDLVQEYPETAAYAAALDQALAQLKSCCPQPVYHVAGNHDVGDKPDPTMPTHPVTESGLEAYHRLFGPSWYGFDRGPIHGIVVNSQILNTDLQAAQSQRHWLEAELAAHADRRLFVFTHLPPYLDRPDEPHLGHYDNIGQPDRAWLLELLQRYRVEWLFAGHVHFSFADRLGPTHYRVVPSTSFTRPGFSHLFTAAAPPERGRDDTPKLGFYLAYLHADRLDLHFIRTWGATEAPRGRRLLVPLATAPQASPGGLGLSLSHPLRSRVQVPVAYPSIIRQNVRNDYPYLSVLESGAGAVRFPWTDLEDPLQGKRLQLLRHQGVALHATGLWQAGDGLQTFMQDHADRADHWEVQLPAGPVPPAACLDALAALAPDHSLGLAAVVAGHRLQGKQHPRTRVGYLAAELFALDELLARRDIRLDAALCRLQGDGWQDIAELAALQLSRLARLDLILGLPATDDEGHGVAAALLAATLLPAARLFFEPLIDLDRTMDGQTGLLDPLCNPRPAFGVARHLHALLQDLRAKQALPPAELRLGRTQAAAADVCTLQAPAHELTLLLPHGGQTSAALSPVLPPGLDDPEVRFCALKDGLLGQGLPDGPNLSGPTLWIAPR